MAKHERKIMGWDQNQYSMPHGTAEICNREYNVIDEVPI